MVREGRNREEGHYSVNVKKELCHSLCYFNPIQSKGEKVILKSEVQDLKSKMGNKRGQQERANNNGGGGYRGGNRGGEMWE